MEQIKQRNSIQEKVASVREEIRLIQSHLYPGTMDPVSILNIAGKRLAEKMAKLNLMLPPAEAEKLETDLAAVSILEMRRHISAQNCLGAKRSICRQALLIAATGASQEYAGVFRDMRTGTQQVRIRGVVEATFIVSETPRR